MPPLSLADLTPCPVILIPRRADSHLDRAVRSGEMVRVRRGIYAVAETWHSLAPWERYRARVYAVAIDYPDAIFIRESAAVLRGMPVFGEPEFVHVVLPGSTTSRAAGDLRMHGAQRLPEHDRIGGLLVATVAEIAADAASLQHPAVGLAVVGAALRGDAELSPDGIRSLLDARPSSRGWRRAQWVLERASDVPESALENVSLATIEWLGFPEPELQVWVRGEHPGDDDRMDFGWRQWRIGAEADGEIKYSGEFGDARTALRERGIRDARLMRRGVSTVRHWGWREVSAWDLLRTILLSAGLPQLRPLDMAPLRTLARALRGRG